MQSSLWYVRDCSGFGIEELGFCRQRFIHQSNAVFKYVPLTQTHSFIFGEKSATRASFNISCFCNGFQFFLKSHLTSDQPIIFILKLWRQESWPFGPGWAAHIPSIRSWTFRLPWHPGMTTYVFTKNLKQKFAVFAVQNNTQVFELFDELRVLINQLITCINKSVPVPRSRIRSMIRKYSVGITVVFHRKYSFSMTETCFENIFFTSQSRELK